MPRFPSPIPPHLAAAVLLVFSLGLASCGSGGLGDTVASASPTGTPSFQPSPPPSAWADEGCVNCHGTDGGGAGSGPNIQCTDYARLDSHVRSTTTSHVGGSHPNLTDQDLLDMVAFLRTADCPATGGDPTNPPPPTSGVPSTHTKNEDGVLHHPDYETNTQTCTACHGANLEGSSFAPSCASCHGSGGFDDDDGTESDDDGLSGGDDSDEGAGDDDSDSDESETEED